VSDRIESYDILSLEGVTKIYDETQLRVSAVRGVSFKVGPGEFVSLIGPSGCGKSTLLNLIAGLDRPTDGTIEFKDQSLGKMTDDRLAKLRQTEIGIVFQFFNLMPGLNVLENVVLPKVLQNGTKREDTSLALELLESVGLKDRLKHAIHQLSGGEQQRAAIARALIIQPSLLLADEPTGNLDSDASAEVLAMIKGLSSSKQCAVIMVTHSKEAAQQSDRIVTLRDGSVISDTKPI
jgi:putative ABC transport system ATP-binding protein